MEPLKQSKSSGSTWGWIVCAILLLATMLNYMDRQALAVTLPTLKKNFSLGEARIGMVEGYFGYAFAFGSIFFGLVADRFGPRFVYPIVITGWSLAGLATAFAGSEWVAATFEASGDPPGTAVFRWLLMCRIALGVFEAGHWPCALLTVRAVLSPKDRTLGNSILQSGASLGAIIVPIYIGAAERAGQTWEFPFWSIGLAGLVWVPIWFILIGRRNISVPKQDDAAVLKVQPVGEETGPEEFTEIPVPKIAANEPTYLIRRMITLAIVIAMLTVSWQFLRAWLGMFLQDYHGYSKDNTRGLMSGYFIAADIGCILSGVLTSALIFRGLGVHSARKVGFAIFTLLTASAALIPFVGDGFMMIALLYTAAAGILGLHPFYYSLAQEISDKKMGFLSGLLAAFAWVVASTNQIYLGKYIEANNSYKLGLIIVGLAPVIGLIALLVLWPAQQVIHTALDQQEDST